MLLLSACGSIRSEFNDTDQSGGLTTGDAITTEYLNCGVDGIRLTGTMRISRVTIDAAQSANMPFVLAMQVELAPLIGEDETGKTHVEGAFQMHLTHVLAPMTLTSMAITGQLIRQQSRTHRSELRNFSLLVDENSTTRVAERRIAGTHVDLNTQHSSTLSTPTPMIGPFGALPASGSIQLVASDGSRARMTAQSSTAVVVEVDADGDGRYESSSPYTWSQIIAD